MNSTIVDIAALEAQLGKAGIRVSHSQRSGANIRVFLWNETVNFAAINRIAAGHGLYPYQRCGWSEGKYFLSFVPLKEQTT